MDMPSLDIEPLYEVGIDGNSNIICRPFSGYAEFTIELKVMLEDITTEWDEDGDIRNTMFQKKSVNELLKEINTLINKRPKC